MIYQITTQIQVVDRLRLQLLNLPNQTDIRRVRNTLSLRKIIIFGKKYNDPNAADATLEEVRDYYRVHDYVPDPPGVGSPVVPQYTAAQPVRAYNIPDRSPQNNA
jgi:hypothetical protein